MVLSNTEFSGIFLMMWVVMMINAKDTNSLLKVFSLTDLILPCPNMSIDGKTEIYARLYWNRATQFLQTWACSSKPAITGGITGDTRYDFQCLLQNAALKDVKQQTYL